MNLQSGLQNKFTHIYVEEEVMNHPRTTHILSLFPSAHIIPVHAYTDVFDRRRQNLALQHQCQNLILACKHDRLIYPSSPVCQDFDTSYFYYCTPVMNCLFDCEYCWLKGMYSSSNLVVFVNQEDYFDACSSVLKEHPLYLCICYENDLLAMEKMLGYGKLWGEYAACHPDLLLELRTKASCYRDWKEIPFSKNIIFAFTLSPDPIIKSFEHLTPSLSQRLEAVHQCMKEGRSVRLCLDPMIYCPGWQKAYKEMVDEIRETIDLSKVRDISVGSFRISKDYLKNMRMQRPDSAVVQYPYACDGGFYHLPDHLDEMMESYLVDLLRPYVREDQIYQWRKMK